VTAARAWRDGVRRVVRAPAVLAGVMLMTLAAGVPLTLVIRDDMARHLGASTAADTAARGVNYDWMQEFAEQAGSLGATLQPTVIGFGAVLDNLDAFVERRHAPIAVTAAGVLYAALWLFVAGGTIDRYARERPTRAPAFFSTCGVFFLRFLRLGVVMAAVYWWLFAYLQPWLLDRAYLRLTRDLTVERTAFFVRLALYVVFLAVVAGVNLLFDYAKVRAVVEDRRSMIGALAAAIRFVRRNLPAAIAVYLFDVCLFAAVIALYAVVAPGAGGGAWQTWFAFAIGQLYLFARLFVKLVFWASETALFQGRLAHAGYVAAPAPTWPESPSVEALRRAQSGPGTA
jgi:hypothetical protein